MRTLTFGLLLMAATPLMAVDRYFEDAVEEIEARTGGRRVKIPMWGLVRWVGSAAMRPVGAKDFDLAVFEDLERGLVGRPFEWLKLGGDWKPVVRVHSPGRESVAIYVRQEGDWYRVLMATVERREAVVMKFAMKPEWVLTLVSTLRR